MRTLIKIASKRIHVLKIVVFLALLLLAIYMIMNNKESNSMSTQETNSTMSNASISKEKALEIATKDANGFLGTWVDTTLENNIWILTAHSKSAKPPVLYRIDAHTGAILEKNLNTDIPK